MLNFAVWVFRICAAFVSAALFVAWYLKMPTSFFAFTWPLLAIMVSTWDRKR